MSDPTLTPHRCPRCGYSLQKDLPLVKGKWHLELDHVRYRDEVVLTGQKATILYYLAQANGRPLKKSVLCELISDNSIRDNHVNVQCGMIKKILAGMKIPYPIITIRQVGLCWDLGRATMLP